jgi:hypothetical protein
LLASQKYNLQTTEITSRWKSFSKKYLDIVYREALQKGFVQSSTEASKDLQTIYLNIIVENYEERIATYLKYRIRTEFKVGLPYVFSCIYFYLIITCRTFQMKIPKVSRRTMLINWMAEVLQNGQQVFLHLKII